MARKRQKKEVKTGEWLNTYADMVTLLLCFFVLLYSMSSIDSQKWEFLVRSLNPNAELQAPLSGDGEYETFEEPQSPEEGEITFDDIEQLYLMLKTYIEEEGLEDSIDIQKGEGFVFLTFRNNIFFDGDSAVLKQGGQEILDVLALGFDGLDNSIGEVRILGHTTQRDPTRVNSAREDRTLSSNRAVEVLLYLQNKGVLEPKKYVSVGHGQHYPISPFDTEANRAQNRRVEIIIIQNDDKVNMALERVYGELGIGYDEQSGSYGASIQDTATDG